MGTPRTEIDDAIEKEADRRGEKKLLLHCDCEEVSQAHPYPPPIDPFPTKILALRDPNADDTPGADLALEEADPVLTLLAELNLGQYYSDVKALGADSLEDLKFIENDDLAFMKPIHRRKFFKQLELM